MAETQEDPFFHRSDVTEAIVEICQQPQLMVFGGAGVTIDRSGLGWAAMIESLLEVNVPNRKLRQYVVNHSREVASATIAEKMFFDAADPEDQANDCHRRISDHLHRALYSPGTWQRGRLARAIAEFMYVWIGERKAAASRLGRRAFIVTTNYDDFLQQALRDSYDQLKRQHKAVFEPKSLYPTDIDPLTESGAIPLASWTRSADFMSQEFVPCIYLHGRVPYDTSSDSRFPVVSERDYHRTSVYTEKTLERLLAKSSAIFVGTSLTDPPLIAALDRTAARAQRRGLRRWALMTTPAPETLPIGVDSSEFKRIYTKRLRALGVQPVYLDFLIQAAQFFGELAICSAENDPAQYMEHNAGIRYGHRLCNWWSRWDVASSNQENERYQEWGHQLLRVAVDCLREILNAPSGEALKMEVWLRWDPYRERKLRLWCSSVGTWVQGNSMREANILNDREYLAVTAFRSGRPEYTAVSTSRWKAYLAAPIWYEDQGSRQRSSISVGVVAIASMVETEDNSLNPDHNSANIARALGFLQAIGSTVASTDRSDVLRVLQDLDPGSFRR